MLSLDHGCERVASRAALAAFPVPPATGRHLPIPHLHLAESIARAASRKGLAVVQEDWGVSHGGMRLYGAIDLTLPSHLVVSDGIGASLGIRHANDRSMSVQLIAGARVFVCSNGCFVGDLQTVRRRHTRGLDLEGIIGEALDEYLGRLGEVAAMHDRLSGAKLTDLRAKALIHDAFIRDQVMATKYLPQVAERYFVSDEHRAQFPERTRWGLYNAFTEVFKRESVQLQLESHRRLSTALDPGRN